MLLEKKSRNANRDNKEAKMQINSAKQASKMNMEGKMQGTE